MLAPGYELRVDLAAVAQGAGVDLASSLEALEKIYETIDARNAVNTADIGLPCARGCDACCHECVFLTPLEFFAAWQYAQDNFDDARLLTVIEEGLRLYEQYRSEIQVLQTPPAEGEADHFSVAKNIKFRCPLLNADGACGIYPARELLGRLFGCAFNEEGGVYGCDDVGAALGGKTLKLLRVKPAVELLSELPLTQSRQIYPYYIHMLYSP